MAKCIKCEKFYIAYDSDAGTYKEHFCSEKCAQATDYAIDNYERKMTWQRNQLRRGA